MKITRHLRHEDLVYPLPLDKKVDIFEEWILGFQLWIADACINGREIDDRQYAPIEGSGYATLSMCLSYFEMIGKAKDGYTGDNRSSFYFKAGVRDVLPELGPWDTEEAEETLDILYTSARCGLYHLCIAQGRLMTTSETASPVEYDKQRRWVVVNPHRLVPRLVGHLTEYTTKLRESGNVCLRQRFERWFDGMQSQDPLDKLDKSRAGQKHRKVRRHDC